MPPAMVDRSPGVDYRWHIPRLIVPRGSIARDDVGTLVESYEQHRRPIRWRPLVGLWSIYLLTSTLLFTYLRRFGVSRGRVMKPVSLSGLWPLKMRAGHDSIF